MIIPGEAQLIVSGMVGILASMVVAYCWRMLLPQMEVSAMPWVFGADCLLT